MMFSACFKLLQNHFPRSLSDASTCSRAIRCEQRGPDRESTTLERFCAEYKPRGSEGRRVICPISLLTPIQTSDGLTRNVHNGLTSHYAFESANVRGASIWNTMITSLVGVFPPFFALLPSCPDASHLAPMRDGSIMRCWCLSPYRVRCRLG